MRAFGLNFVAVIGAAIAIYAVGFVIFGLVVPEDMWLASQGLTKAQITEIGFARLAWSWAMPLATALFMAVLFAWAQVKGAVAGMRWALVIALASALPADFYLWVYGVKPLAGPLIDSAHLIIGHVAAGAILGRWR